MKCPYIISSLLFFFFGGFISNQPNCFAQKTVEGITFSKTKTVEGETLMLNGAGLREKFFLDLYVAGLYLPKTTSNVAAICDGEQSYFLDIRIVSSLINGEKIADAIKEGFQKATNNNTSSIQKDINSIVSLFKENSLTKGETCAFFYSQKTGLQVYINNALQKTFTDHKFKSTFLKIWLGENPADKTLKQQLLNL